MAQTGNAKRIRSWITTLARAGTLAALAYIALIALWLLFFGLPITSYQELPEGFQGAPYLRSAYSQPYPAAVVYLGLTGLAMVGLIRSKWLWLAWLSVGLITMWSALWLFSIGAALLPANGITIVLLAIVTRTWIKPIR